MPGECLLLYNANPKAVVAKYLSSLRLAILLKLITKLGYARVHLALADNGFILSSESKCRVNTSQEHRSPQFMSATKTHLII